MISRTKKPGIRNVGFKVGTATKHATTNGFFMWDIDNKQRP